MASKKEILQAWITAFNNADTDQLAALYHEDAVNHQVANEPVKGKKAIRAMFAKEFAAASMTCIPEQILEDGDWVIMEWKDPLGFRGCGFFNIVADKIQYQRGYWDKLSFLRMHKLPIE